MSTQHMTRFHTKTVLTFVVATAVVAVLAPRPAAAQFTSVGPTNSIQTVSDTAAATLMGPYFEVDLGNPTGMNTIFTVNNTGAPLIVYNMGIRTGTDSNGPTAILAHVTIWSDLGVPVFNFNIYLTGYDVERIDMRKVLNGQLPQTASAGQDPSDTISPKGSRSQDINFNSCASQNAPAPTISSFSSLPPATLTAAQIANLQTSLTGSASAGKGGLCAGANHNDNIARGYITIDTVDNCTARFPSDAGYFGNGLSGDATNQSYQLTGEVFFVDQLHDISRGDNMVHIHADATAMSYTATSGNYTFYGRYDNWTAADNRQPLPTSFGARYLNGNFTADPVAAPVTPAWGAPPASPPAGSTSLIVWRDSKVAQSYFACGNLPAPYPLSQEGIVAFDEQEHPQGVFSNTFTPTSFGAAFPLATQVVKVGSAALPVSFTSGWVYLDLNQSNSASAGKPPVDPLAAQAWVVVIEQNGSQVFNVMHRAQAQDSGTMPVHVIPH